MMTNTSRRWRRGGTALLTLGAIAASSGCAAAVGAAMAAQELRRGFAGVQQLVGNARSLRDAEIELPRDLTSPLAGTYRAHQLLGEDTLVYYVRTVERPTAPIIDEAGLMRGYVLAGLAASSLESLEARVGQRGLADEEDEGRALFFVEGTQPPDPSARTLYPAAFLGRVASGESAEADRQREELEELEIEMQAPEVDELEGRGIPYELFDSVAEGLFTLTPTGDAVYEQEYQAEDGRTLELRFERISGTTLPEPRGALGLP